MVNQQKQSHQYFAVSQTKQLFSTTLSSGSMGRAALAMKKEKTIKISIYQPKYK